MLDPLSSLRFGAHGSNERAAISSLALVLLVISAIWIVAASRWIVTDTVVPWDAKNQFYAFFRFLASSVHSGQAPFWNPYHYGGHPSVADPQSLIFAPAFVLWALFDPAPSIRTFDLIVYAHLLAGALAVGALGWRAGWPAAASVLAAAIFMFGGPASGRLQHTGMILSYAMFPVALLLLLTALQARSVLLAAAFGIVAAVLALGRNHEALLLCFVLVAVLGGMIATAADRRSYLRERLAVLLTMGGVGVALVALPLLLTLQFAALSNRPEIQLEASLEASLYPANLASLAVANIFGSLESTLDYWGPNYDTLPAVGATDRSFNYLFIGLASTIVLLWFGVIGGWLLRRGSRLMTGVLVVATLYTLGRYSPLYGLSFEYVPGIHLFRRPIDGAFVVVAVLALLAGRLLADYVREGIPRVPAWRTVSVAAAALGIVAWAVIFSEKSHRGWSSFVEVLKVAPIAVLAVILLARARTAQARGVAAICVAAIATGELIWFNSASSLNAEGPAYYAVLQEPKGDDAQVVAVLQQEVKKRHAEGQRPRVEVVGVSGSWQNLAMVQGLEATNGYNPLRLGGYDRLVSPGETTYLVDQRLFPASFDGYDCALARELGLEYVVLGRPIEEVPHLARRPVSDILLAGPRAWIYRLRGARPRVKFTARVVIIDSEAQTKSGRFHVDPGKDQALIDGSTVPLRRYWLAGAGGEPSRTRIVAWHNDRVAVEVVTAQPGILVLNDLYYPGWVAEVDGQPTRILRTNVLFRGVEVSEGRHMVVFRFRPFSLANLRDAALTVLHLPH